VPSDMDHRLVNQGPDLAAALNPPLAKGGIFRSEDPIRINVGKTLQHRSFDRCRIVAILVRAADKLGLLLGQLLERLSPDQRDTHTDPSRADKPIFDVVLASMVPF